MDKFVLENISHGNDSMGSCPRNSALWDYSDLLSVGFTLINLVSSSIPLPRVQIFLSKGIIYVNRAEMSRISRNDWMYRVHLHPYGNAIY